MPRALSCKKRHNQSELFFGNQLVFLAFIIDCWHCLLALLVPLPSPFGCCASVLSEMMMLWEFVGDSMQSQGNPAVVLIIVMRGMMKREVVLDGNTL